MNSSFNPLISFIIPAYNVATYIEKCVLSIVNQNYKNIEIIVVNDGSKDNTLEILSNISKDYPIIKVIDKVNEGVSVARNTGIKESKGDYLVFVDADDFLAADYASYMLKLVGETQSEFCLSTCCYERYGESQTENETIKKYTPEEATALLLSPQMYVGCWNKIFKRSLIVDNKIEFSSSLFYGEGLRFITQVSQKCTSVGVGNRKVYYYRKNNQDSACTHFDIEKHYNGMKSLMMIKGDLKLKSPMVLKMLDWHICQFNVGTVVRINAHHKVKENKDYYKECLAYVRKHSLPIVLKGSVSLYYKAILIGCCISPKIMSILDEHRRKYNTSRSVE